MLNIIDNSFLSVFYCSLSNIFRKKQLATLYLILFAISFSCKTPEDKNSNESINSHNTIEGNYVSDGYEKRSEGYDWVSVSVKYVNDRVLNLSIRSRSDIKKPTCTFDTKIYKADSSKYQTVIKGKSILFLFTKSSITIQTENRQNEDLLKYYCSGGGTIAGTYKRIDAPLDSTQIDKTKFRKTLTLQGVRFNISSIESNNRNTLSVLTEGLPIEYNETFDLKGWSVTNAETEDLNSDGSPELIVFAYDNESETGNVYAFSVNNKKSMSMVYFKNTVDNDEINEGYQGEDTYAIIETKLVQRFPIYEKGIKTDKIRQVSYNLVEGEALRQFVVDSVDEFTN